MTRWTPQQQEAITIQNRNLLVSAAAGSGKTAVLIQRIIRLVLEDQIDIDRLLVVTFTRAAASEMRERTAAALLKHIEISPERESYIRRQLSLLHESHMMTFHAFCIKILRHYYYLINLDPDFRTLDQAEAEIIRREALEAVLEKHYQAAHPSFMYLTEMFTRNYDDKQLMETVNSLYDFSRSQPDPVEWLVRQTGGFGAEDTALLDSEWIKMLIHLIRMRVEVAVTYLNLGIGITKLSDGPSVYGPVLEKEKKMLEEILHSQGASGALFFQLIRSIKFNRLPASHEKNPVLREKAKSFRDLAKKEMTHIKEEWCGKSLTDYQSDHQKLFPALQYLVNIIREFDEVYSERKRSRKMMDFFDLEHGALAILRHKEVRQHYQKMFKAVLVDEYQDSNRVQETLIQQVKRCDNLFMVGDARQSIYRFRLAEPELFFDKYKQYHLEENCLNKKIDLNQNFRSHPSILQGINTLFQMIMSETVGDVEYDNTAMLRPGNDRLAQLEPSPIEVNLLQRLPDGGRSRDSKLDDEAETTLYDWSTQEVEARLMVKLIHTLLDDKIFDEAENRMRSIQYRDITILLRAPGIQAPPMMEVFSSEGIPVYTDMGTGFYESLEINWLISLLKIIDNGQQDIPLLSVLRSPLGGFTTDELSQIRAVDRENTFVEAFHQVSRQTGALGDKANIFLQRTEEWRSQLRIRTLQEFLWWLLTDTGLESICAAMPGGKQRQANLRMLLKRASEFSNANESDLYLFLEYVGKIKFQKGKESGPARTLTENENVIRIMSVHKSKGLEFPVVIMGGLSRQFNQRDIQQPLLLHRTLGLGPLYVEPEMRIKRDTLARIVIREKLKWENLSEEMRILYVGMTRAQQKLMMTGVVTDLKTCLEDWDKPITYWQQLKARKLIDWMGPAWLRMPEGEALKNNEGKTMEKLSKQSASGWVFHLWEEQQLMKEMKDRIGNQEEIDVLLSESLREDSSESTDFQWLTWTYPYADEIMIPTKMSVTDQVLISKGKHQSYYAYQEFSAIQRRPRFLEEKTDLTSAEKGSALHYFLQHIDYTQTENTGQIRKQLNNMLGCDMIRADEAATIDTKIVLEFFRSEMGMRMKASSMVRREMPFVIRTSDMTGSLVQGVIDCCFMEQNKWILIDYKTDHFQMTGMDTWKEQYRPQLMIYKEALESLTGVPVGACYLYAFSRQLSILIDG